MPTRRQRPARILFFTITTFDIAFDQSNLSTIGTVHCKKVGKPLTIFYSVHAITRRQRPARILLQPCQPKLASRVVTRGAKMMVPAPDPQVEIPATKQTIGFSELVVLKM